MDYSYNLDISVKPTRNFINGKFLKGHPGYHKGKKWEDFMDKEMIIKVKKNLEKGNVKKGDPPRYSVKIVAIKDGKFLGCFESSKKAGDIFKLNRSHISSCANGNRKSTGGIQFFKESDNAWTKLINN